jgi:hypothetical protein
MRGIVLTTFVILLRFFKIIEYRVESRDLKHKAQRIKHRVGIASSDAFMNYI